MRIIFMGTPTFALPTLEALHASDHEIVAVYTQPPRPAKRGQKDTPSPVHIFAQQHALPVHTPVSLKSQEAQEIFAAHKADVTIVVAYGLLLPKPILDATPMGCINVHPSALPRWRGAAPIQRTIMAGDTDTAIVIMQMDEGLDTGDMLLVEDYPIPPGTTAGMLHDTLAREAAPLVLKALAEKPSPRKQPEEGALYAKKITKEECHIDWNNPAEDICNRILGLAPAPGAYFLYNGEKIKLFDAEFSTSDKHFEGSKPGEVLSHHLDIKCGSGVLTLQALQRPGKTRMMAQEFLQGFAIPPGSILS